MRHSQIFRSPCLPWCIIGLAICFAYGALKIGVADFLYPQEQPLQPQHWIFSMAPSQQQQRLERALAWTPGNTWYWQALGHISRAAEPQATEHAARFYQRALTYTPTDPYLHLAWQLTRLEKKAAPSTTLNEADTPLLSLYTGIASLAPSDPEVQYRIGTAMRDRAAITFFRRAMVLNPAYYNKTLQLYLKRYPETEAILWFSRTIPNTSQGHDQAARLLESISWSHARYHYLRAMALEKKNTDLVRRFANALQSHQDNRAAAKMWRWLQSIVPDDASVYSALADNYRRQGDDARWLHTLRQRATHFPRELAYQDQLADAYLQLGQLDAAHDIWQALTRTQPQAAMGYLGLAKLYASHQRHDEAIAMMQRAVNLVPGTIDYHRRLAQLYERAGATARALHEYKRLAALRPDHPWALYYLGEHFRQAGAYTRAISYFQRAHILDPTQSIYLYQLGRTQASRGEHHLAIKAYRRALALNTHDYNAHYQLGLSYDRVGQSAQAHQAYEQVVRLAPNPQAFPKACQQIRCSPTR